MKRVADALGLLRRLGAGSWLVRHHELVAEAARELLDALPERARAALDHDRILVAAALHDVGKIAHPAETVGPGNLHEAAGEAILLQAGLPPEIARVGVTHAHWGDPRADLEDRLVALADKLWKGKRDPALEEDVTRGLAQRARLDFWDVFPDADAAFERVAEGADDSLARSRVGP